MKKIYFFIICLFVMILVSCTVKHNEMLVTSDCFDGLDKVVEGDFNEENLVKFYITDSEIAKLIYVTEENGKINITDKVRSDDVKILKMNNGYFVGIDLGEFDGWVYYYPYYSHQSIYSDLPKLICKENLVCFFQIDNNNAYMLTYSYFTSKSYLYEIKNMKDTPLIEKIEEFDNIIGYYESKSSKILYILFNNRVVEISSDGIKIVIESKMLEKIYATSVIVIDEKIYCGSASGIYEYDKKSNKETWYPINLKEYKYKNK